VQIYGSFSFHKLRMSAYNLPNEVLRGKF